MRNLMLAGVAVAALAGCADVPGSGPPGYGWYVEAPPIAAPAPSPPIAAAPVNSPVDLTNNGVNDNSDDNPSPAPVHPRRQRPQVTTQPDDEPPVADLSPPPIPAPPPSPPTPADQRSLWDRLGLPHITPPANGATTTVLGPIEFVICYEEVKKRR
jgi:hypothetical protein